MECLSRALLRGEGSRMTLIGTIATAGQRLGISDNPVKKF